LKKLALLGAIVAMVVMAAAPAVAQVGQGFSERRVTSGTASPKTEVSNKGNNVNLCTELLQAAQTGNVANEQGALQYQSKSDDIDFSGSSVELTPAAVAECTQTIEQAAAAGPKAEAKAGKAEAKGGAPEAKAGKAEAKAGAPEAKAGELPKTGGIAGTASLLGLGAGALLVAGGLLARRIIR
jgi:LPXTG-motif cell wall-anchored protein